MEEEKDKKVNNSSNIHNHKKPHYPFSAIVGQEDLKLCLILCAIDPSIGGVLIQGDKGTAKSTAARGLAQLLPMIEVGFDLETGAFNPYNDIGSNETKLINTPFVDLPIGATEDRVLGSLDFAGTISSKKPVFAPGLLAAANRGILYIDEVNLLPAHLVDVLLDAAAMGVNTVQREGVHIVHNARFMLIGTMNPEEGDLRPQLLDRFGLVVHVQAPNDPTLRSQVVRRRIAFDRSSIQFSKDWNEAELTVKQQIHNSKQILEKVTIQDEYIFLMSQICIEFGVDSLRADITLYKTTRALAAWHGRDKVNTNDIKQASKWVLKHRSRQNSNHSSSNHDEDEKKIDQLIYESNKNESNQNLDNNEQDYENNPQDYENNQQDLDDDNQQDYEDNQQDLDKDMQTFNASMPDQIKKLKLANHIRGGQPGRRNSSQTTKKGHYIRSKPTDQPIDLAFDATLRAAAQSLCDSNQIRPEHFRRKVRHSTRDTLILFVVDASGSMSARHRMETIKGTINQLLSEAYQNRDRVGVVSFRGVTADLLLPPTKCVKLAQQHLQHLPTGGRTPLAHALFLTHQIIEQQLKNNVDDQPDNILLIVLSDGKANVPLPPNLLHDLNIQQNNDPWKQTQYFAKRLANAKIPTLMVDTDLAHIVRVGRGKELAELLKADYLQLDDLTADNLFHTIKHHTSNKIE